MRKIIFIDRDGTLIVEPLDNFQIDSLAKLSLLPKVIRNLYYLQNVMGYELVMVTNQDGLGTDSFPESDFWEPHNKMMEVFENEDVRFKEVLIDKSFEYENSPTRKPRAGLVTHYMGRTDIDYNQCFMIGDRLTDVELAYNMGIKGILLNDNAFTFEEKHQKALALQSADWDKVAQFIEKTQGRTGTVHRITKETDIYVKVSLDNNAFCVLDTGIGFFDHMLEQIAKHARIGLEIKVKGDLHIDEHHSIEDTGIALGEAFKKALQDKRGIGRYGHFTLPMDETLAQVALDFSGRSYFAWNAPLQREKVGSMPTEMVEHFFKSFSDAAQCNLHITAQGCNDHHIIEGIFKAFAKAVKMAITIEHNDLPSTKGIL